MTKLIAKIHLWLAIPFGLVISIMCLTGAILVFESEFQQITDKKKYFVEAVSGSPMPLETLLPRVQAQLPDTLSLSGVTLPARADQNYRMGLAGQGRTSLTVDPYTGEIRGKIQPYEKGKFFTVVRRLHRWFLFQNQREGISWGKLLTGTSTLIFFFIIVSGIVI